MNAINTKIKLTVRRGRCACTAATHCFPRGHGLLLEADPPAGRGRAPTHFGRRRPLLRELCWCLTCRNRVLLLLRFLCIFTGTTSHTPAPAALVWTYSTINYRCCDLYYSVKDKTLAFRDSISAGLNLQTNQQSTICSQIPSVISHHTDTYYLLEIIPVK